MKSILENIRIMKKYSLLQTVLLTVIHVLSGFCPIVTVVFVTKFVTLALESAGTGIINQEIYLNVAAIIFFNGYEMMLPTLEKLISEKAKLNIRKNYRIILLEKCAKLEYHYIESAESWNLISRVLDKPENTIVDNYVAMNQVLSIFISVTGVISIIFAQAPWAAAIIVASCAPLFYFSVRSGKANYKAKVDTAEFDRRCEYYSEILSDRDNVDERSIFGYSDKLNDEYHSVFKESFQIKIRTRFKWFVKTKLGGVFTAFAAFIVIVVLMEPAISGKISLGMFISLVNAILSLTGRLSWGLSFCIDTIVSGSEYIKDILKLIEYEESPGALAKPVPQAEIESIEFRNVNFIYPGTDKQILRNISFVLEGGKHYALVGANGAGKTTVIKLLTGLYTNYNGEILINGKELREYDCGELKGFFSIVYQDFSKHEFTFRENISIGNLDSMNDGDDDVLIKSAVKLTELDKMVDNLPEGLDTNLGKIHKNGVDLSGGEWQRIAVTRAIVSKAPMRILDEPTASLDPISENKIYELFGRINHDLTTVFISHRLASTKIADEILVFNEGTIVENGSFESLMNLKGLYFQMFEQQRSWYQ